MSVVVGELLKREGLRILRRDGVKAQIALDCRKVVGVGDIG